jgi:hypothetical protein
MRDLQSYEISKPYCQKGNNDFERVELEKKIYSIKITVEPIKEYEI